jgi:hypothetical protein
LPSLLDVVHVLSETQALIHLLIDLIDHSLGVVRVDFGEAVTEFRNCVVSVAGTLSNIVVSHAIQRLGAHNVGVGHLHWAFLHAHSVEDGGILESILTSLDGGEKISEVLILELGEISCYIRWFGGVALGLIKLSAHVSVRVKWCKDLDWISSGVGKTRAAKHSNEENCENDAA